MATTNTQLRGYNTDSITATGYELGGVNTTGDVQAGSYLRWYQVNGTPIYGGNLRLNGVGTGGVLINDSGSGNPSVVLNGNVTLDSDAKITGANSGRFNVHGNLTGDRALTWEQGALTSTIAGPVDLTALTKTGGGIYIDTLTGTQLTITGNVINTINNAVFRDIRFTGGGTTILQGALLNSTTAIPTLKNSPRKAAAG